MAIRFQKYKFLLLLLFVVCGCNQSSETFSNKEMNIEKKIDSVLGLMTLEEKIGQMSQVRHFSDISENDVATKFIGSIIHTQGKYLEKQPKNGNKNLVDYKKRPFLHV